MAATDAPKGLPMAGEAWGEIDPSLLEDPTTNAPGFPLHLLTPKWAGWIRETAHAASAPPDYVALGLFGAVAAVSGAGVVAQVHQGWLEPLVLWLALVGNPSSGKSPALAAARRLLGPIEDELRASDDDRQRDHATKVKQAKLLCERWEDECEAALKQGAPPPLKPVEAAFDAQFVRAQLLVADTTIEALADVVSGNPRGVTLWRDELAAWLGNLGRYANGGSDRAYWLEAWGAAAVTINRRSRSGPLSLKKFPVSIVGSIQPDRLAEALGGTDDGMAARFLYTWPAPAPYRSLLDHIAVHEGDAIQRLGRIAAVVGIADSPLTLILSHDALVMFDEFRKKLLAEQRDLEGPEAGWLGKGPGSVVRVASLLTLLGWSEGQAIAPPAKIERAALAAAISLWNDYMRAHAQAVFNKAGRTGKDRNLRRVVRWLMSAGIDEVSREDVRCTALARAVDADGADQVIARLVKANVLRQVPSLPAGPKGGRPVHRWAVNPALAGSQRPTGTPG
ncbi:hypothetical protein RSO01_25200 [Reyranella soli]|uniref:DUF3987 domain-containing protein n=2 Tax=Reyranella soli TaxID=1230389 RepID=A0A512N8P8_9HYPH|nr:hypothetical protein RSO01_25200 [Reyranella soli]